MNQATLFSPDNLAATVEIPSPPALVPHAWPFPGLTPEDSARAAMAISSEYMDMLAAVIKAQGAAVLTDKQVMALVPKEWRDLLGIFGHMALDFRTGEERGIKVDYVSHDGGGFHFTYQAIEIQQQRKTV